MKRHSLAKAILYVVGLGLLVAAGDLFGQGNTPRTYDTVAQLTNSSTAFASGTQLSALVRGSSGPAGGVFYWSSTATNAVDGTNYFPATTSGRWVRVTYWTLDTVDDTYTNFWSDLTNYVAAGTNILLTVGTNKLLINSLASGGTVTVNGTTVVTNFYNAGYHSFNDAGGGNINIDHPDGSITKAKLENFPATSILGNSSGSSGPSEYLTAGANITISGGQISASVLGGGATNGTPVSVNGGSLMTWANLINSAAITFTISSSTNIYGSIVDSSITTNKIDSTFWNWINGKTSIANLNDLSDVNIGTPSTGQLLMYTNSIWTNLTVSLGGGTTYTGTNGVTVSGSVISGFYYPSNNIAFTTNANGSISIAAVISTNSGTSVYVDTAGPQSVVNLSDNSDVDVTLTGTNATFTVTKTNYSELNLGTLNLTNRLTTNVLTLSTSPVIIGRTLGGAGVAQELTLTGAGAVTIFTNSGGIIVSNPVVTGGGTSSNVFTVNGSTNLPVINIQDSANVTWARSSQSNLTATFSGVGSNTNGYLVRYSTNVANLTDDSEDHLFIVVIPANTFQADGDEVEWYIPGKFLNNSGSTGGYTWRFNYGGATVVYGALDNDFPNSSSALASEWRIRMKRKDATTIQTIASHNVGSDSATFSTNNINTVVYDESETVSDLASNGLTVDFSLQNSASHASLGHTLFGYTLVKIGSVGAGGSGSGGNVYTSSNNVFTGTNSFPSINLNGQTETNWPTYGVRRNATKVAGVPYWDEIIEERGYASSAGGGSDSGGTGSANGGTLAQELIFGHPGAKTIRVNSTNDAPTFGWITTIMPTNSGAEVYFGEAYLRVRTLSIGTSEIQVRAGFFSGSTGTNIPNNTAICIYDTNRVGTAWGFLTSTNGTLGTITQSGTTVTADSWVKLGVALYADQTKGAVGYINGTPFATNTANLPNGQQIGFGVGVAQVSGAGTANMDISLDWMRLHYYSGQ